MRLGIVNEMFLRTLDCNKLAIVLPGEIRVYHFANVILRTYARSGCLLHLTCPAVFLEHARSRLSLSLSLSLTGQTCGLVSVC
jgi:hypothetical protein